MSQASALRAVLLCMSVLWSSGAGATDPVNERSAGDCFVAGMEANNAEDVAACYAEDGIIWFPGGPIATGRAAIRDGFAHFLQGVIVKDVEMTTLGHEAFGDSRVAWGTYVIRTVQKATQIESVQRGRYTDVQKKIDGRWLYTVDHPSDDPAQ